MPRSLRPATTRSPVTPTKSCRLSDEPREGGTLCEQANTGTQVSCPPPAATRPIDYPLPFGVTSLSSPVAKSKTNPRIATSEGIHGCDLSFRTCFCVVRFTSE